MKNKLFLLLLLPLFIIVSNCKKEKADDDTVKDADNNTYNTVKIGEQWWMTENLKTTKYRNNTAIEFPNDNKTNWSNDKTGAYAWYNDDIANKNTHGALYNWYAVTNTSGLCPQGWKVPTESDWETLINSLGGNAVAGGKLKLGGTTYWENPNIGATNESGFAAKASGRRYFDGSYNNLKYFGHWWTATEQYSTTAKAISLYHNDAETKISPEHKGIGFSVRCVKE